jgi:hypothetical protein
MKPGGWLDAFLFMGGAFAGFAGDMWRTSREAHSATTQIQMRMAVQIGGLVFFFGALIYRAAQQRRLEAGLLYPRRPGAAISLSLGVAYALLWAAGARALQPVFGGWAALALWGLLPWALSRAQWTTAPPGSQ